MRRPNIVFVVADDLGWADLGCYGARDEPGGPVSPQIDRLASGGLRFTQCYNTTRCWPSRGCILTGYYAQQIHRDTLPGIPSGGSGMCRRTQVRNGTNSTTSERTVTSAAPW